MAAATATKESEYLIDAEAFLFASQLGRDLGHVLKKIASHLAEEKQDGVPLITVHDIQRATHIVRSLCASCAGQGKPPIPMSEEEFRELCQSLKEIFPDDAAASPATTSA